MISIRWCRKKVGWKLEHFDDGVLFANVDELSWNVV